MLNDNDLSSMIAPMHRLTRDLYRAMGQADREGVGGVTDSEARYLVDTYYQMQESRIRSNNRVKGLERDAKREKNKAEPHDALDFVQGQFALLEKNLASILGVYAETHPMGWFFAQTVGIGPIISAGLLAHIDIKKAATAGALWRFAGMEPTQRWESEATVRKLWEEHEQAHLEDTIEVMCKVLGRRSDTVIRDATTNHATGKTGKLTRDKAIKALCRIPYNRPFKTLLWKAGESFVKVKNREDAFYGREYAKRKAAEWQKNVYGGFADAAAQKLATTAIGKSTDAYAWYSGAVDAHKVRALLREDNPIALKDVLAEEGRGTPMLPPAHIHNRATRYVRKLFLSHLWECWREQENLPIVKPFSIAIQGHAHYVAPPQKSPIKI